MSKPLRISLGALLVIPLLATTLPTAEAGTTFLFAITSTSANPKVGFSAFDGNPVKLFDIDGDGRKEIIAQNDNQYVYVFDSKQGTLLAEIKTNFPAGWGARSFNGPEAAIMSKDGQVHLVIANSAAVITLYKFDITNTTNAKFMFHKVWERRLNDCHSNPGMDSKPVLADLDRDQRFEILAGTEELGVFALRMDGTLFWKQCLGGGNAEPGVGDLDLDGWPDVVHVSDAGVVTALQGRSGAWMWDFKLLKTFNLGSASIPVGPAIAQLDGVGGPDIVVGARDSHDPENWSNDHALLLALDSNGKLLWAKQDPQANPLTYTHPVVVDADRDGAPEVYWGDWNTVGHKPPFDEQAWKTTGPAHFYRFSAQGNLVWRQTLPTWWSNKDVPIADVDGDGVQEMLANGPDARGHDGIWYLDTRTGAKETFVDVHPWKVMRAPVVADLWGTGTTQWVLEAGGAEAGGPSILVFDTGVPFNAAWPHLAEPVLGTPPPPPAGFFGAKFSVKSPNEWWQEVVVEPDSPRTLAKVEVRIGGTFWQTMTKRSWGAWASSYNTKPGVTVDFLATDTSGRVSQSHPFTWMDGVLVKRSIQSDPTTTTTPPPSTTTPPPTTTTTIPPPSGFTATYTVPSGVNEWWVEVRVSSTHTIAAVTATVNGGGPTTLAKTSWGTWAKSFFVEAGSQVRFQATSSTGATHQSEAFTWLRSGTPPAEFTATFQPCCTDNNWWVEVKMTSQQTVVKVEAIVDSNAPTPLSKTSWGTWAKSFFVPDNASVRFRATNSDGASVESATFTWI